MRGKLILSGTAAVLLAGVSLAAAQGPAHEPGGAAPAPNTQSQPKNTPERPKAAPAKRSEAPERGQVQRNKESHPVTGQATPGKSESKRGAAEQKGAEHEQKGAEHKGAESTPKTGDQRRDNADNKPDADKDRQNQQTQKGEPGKAQPNQTQTQRGRPDAKENDQTQGQAAARANVSPEQRTKIRQSVHKMGNAPRVNKVNFTISVGTVVPRTVRVVPLPAAVIAIEPTWRGYMFFLVGDEIIVVEPRSHRIVAVLPA